jgi:purine-cytosine permease-like protein
MGRMEYDGGSEGNQPSPAADAHPGPRRSTFTPASADAYAQFSAATSTFPAVPVDAPPPNPSTVVTPPPGSKFPRPPQRRSLDDDQILSTLDKSRLKDGGVLDAIEQLQAQLRIREEESREFRSWESSMLAIGTREALEVVEDTRVTFTGAIQIIPQQVAAGRPGPLADDARILDTESDPDESITDVVPTVAPIESARTEPRAAVVIADAPVGGQRIFSPETSGAEPTLPEQRTGGAFRLFWLWFAANSSVLSIVLGGMLLSLGMSLRQAVVATLAGVALSFLPIGLGTLAGKWNGQPTMVASRASFGLIGNVAPAVLALVTRLLWGAVLLWFLASMTADLLISLGADGGLGDLQLTMASAGAVFLIALLVAFFGYRLLGRVHLVLGVASAVLVIMVIVITWPLVDIRAALTIGDGPWMLVITGAVLVFTFVGLVWSTAAGDLARHQRPSGAGAGSMLAASFGNALPGFVLIVYGSVLASSDPALAFGFVVDPVATLTSIVPPWFLMPLIAAVVLGLLAGIILSIYSGGYALLAVVPLRRELAVLVVGLLLGATAIGFIMLVGNFAIIFRDLATTFAVPTAAWLGIFAAEMMIRNRRFHTRSLVQRGGVYPDVNWVNLGALVLASAIGFGFTSATTWWLSWQGYLLELAGVSTRSDLARADIGVLVALVFALLVPIMVGVRTIRRQEAGRA